MAAIGKFLLAYGKWVMLNWVNVLITAGIVAIASGSVAGYYGYKLKGKIVQIQTIERIVEVTVQDATAVNEARTKGAELQRQNDNLRDLNRQLGDMLASAIPNTPPLPNPEEPKNASCPDLSRHIHLTAYAVGLLNRALDGSAPDPKGWSDEQKQTLEAVGLRELSDRLTEVATEYRILGKNHDALVDDVAAFQTKQLENRRRAQ